MQIERKISYTLTMFSLSVDADLNLELLELHHAEVLHNLIINNREHLNPWMPWADTTKSVADTEAFIAKGLERFSNRNGFELGLIYKNDLVGVIGLHSINWVTRNTELGYWLAKDAQGKGLMSKSVEALITQIFKVYKLERIELRAMPTNHRSRSVATRLGFTQEGILRQAGMGSHKNVDLIVYSLLQEEWQVLK